jgi:phosphoribosylformylglycinamidine synthase
MLSQLSTLIPGAKDFPPLLRNSSEQFEARLVMVDVPESKSLFLTEMKGSQIPIIISHGEGRIEKTVPNIVMRYIDNAGEVTDRYPYNPNGSVGGIAGVCSEDGRVTLLMPHPERCIRTENLSWHPEHWGEWSPWFNMFLTARKMI